MIVCPVSLANVNLHFFKEHLQSHDFLVSTLLGGINLLQQVVSLRVRLFLISLQVIFQFAVVRVHLVFQFHDLLAQVIGLQFCELDFVVGLVDSIERYHLASPFNHIKEWKLHSFLVELQDCSMFLIFEELSLFLSVLLNHFRIKAVSPFEPVNML